MKGLTRLRLLIPLVVATLGPARIGHSQVLGDSTLDPRTYRSPSGEYALHVAPSQPSGAGPATYRLTRGDLELWSAERPYTFQRAVVADDGVSAGYAYALGACGGKEGDALWIVILDASGAALLEGKTPRHGIVSCLGSPQPMVRDLFLDPANDRLVVRLREKGDAQESWWIHALSTGERVGRQEPRHFLFEDERIGVIDAARPVPGTPLTLVQWSLTDYDTQSYGALFDLVDLEGRPVWSFELPRDYSVPDDEAAQDRLRQEMLVHGALLPGDGPGRFTLRHVADGLQVTYAVSELSGERQGWQVREIARAPFAGLAAEEGATPAESAGPAEVSLQHLGTIELRSARSSPGSLVHDVMAWDVDGSGRLGFVRRDGYQGSSFDFVAVDPAGELEAEIPLPGAPDGDWWIFHVAWIAGDRWVLSGSSHGQEQGSRAWWIDLPARVNAIEGFEAPLIDALAGAPDGGFVALTTTNVKYGMIQALLSFDPDGRPRGSTESSSFFGSDDPAALLSPEDVTVTDGGEIVVIDNIAKRLQVFDAQIRYLREIDLASAWGREPRYPTGVESDPEGGLVVHDFNGQPPVVRMDRDGKVVAAFEPHFRDGRRFTLRDGVHAGPDGSLWTCDGQSLLRLDREGVVEAVLGAVPDPEILTRIAAIALGPGDRIHAVDARSGAVHVFLPDGTPAHVCRPEPADLDQELSLPVLVIGESGDVHLRGMGLRGTLHFTADGERMGVEAPSGLSQASTGNRWVFERRKLVLQAPSGATLRAIDHAPDGGWLRSINRSALAPDGSIALASDDASGNSVVHLYSCTGDPLRTIERPAGSNNWSPFAYDGARLAFGVDPEDAPAAVVLVDAQGTRFLRFTPERVSQSWSPFFAAGGKELWLHDGERKIERYALP